MSFLPRTRRTAALAASVALLAGTGVAATAPAAEASTPTVKNVGKGLTLSPYEARLLKLVNKARAAHHLKAVVAEPGSTDVARRWSLHLAAVGSLSHNPVLVSAMEKAGSNSWTSLAENVGEGPAKDADRMFSAYMASPSHRANILAPWARYIGMGAVQVTGADGSAAWNTMTFTNAYSKGYGKERTFPSGPLDEGSLGSLAGRWRTSL